MDPHRPWFPLPEDRETFTPASSLPFDYEDRDDAQDQAAQAVFDSEDDAAVAALQEALSRVYDEELLGVDRALDTLLAGLAMRGLDQDTLVVFTADHGESIFDRRNDYGHGGSLKDEQVHVPLVFFHPFLPGALAAPCLTQTWDVYPTLLELLGLPAMTSVWGRSALDVCRGEARSSLYRRVDQLALHFLLVRTRSASAFVSCEDGERHGHDLSDDPHELERQTPRHPLVKELQPSLDAYIEEVVAGQPGVACPRG